MASSAFCPRESSASASSRVVDISRLHMFLAHQRTEPFDRPIKAYSLDDLGLHLGISASCDQALSIKKQNEKLAERCVMAACKNMKFCIKNDKEVMNSKGLKASKLSSLVTSSHERPDVIVYDEQHNKLLLLIEVQSSPMVFSERKAVIGAANALRFLRNSDNNFDEFSAFVFPKKGEKQSMMKVTVTWNNFHFQYCLKRLSTVDAAVEEIKSVVNSQSSRVPVLPEKVDPFWMCLSPEDIRRLSTGGKHISTDSGAKQIPSESHIIVESKDTMHKLVYDIEECLALQTLYWARVRPGQLIQNPHHFILPKESLVVTSHHFTYTKVPYGPLTVQKAKKCLFMVSMKINTALQQLHGFGFAHNDIRLENICFSRDFDVVFIDLERCTPVSKVHPLMGASSSCMYQFPAEADFTFDGKHSDYMQLGWLVAWVLHQSGSYHTRVWDDLPLDLRSDPFIFDLIKRGEFSQEKLNNSKTIVLDTADDFSALF